MVDSIFVYGTLKSRNLPLGLSLMSDAVFVTESATSECLFDMYDHGPFPSVCFGGSSYVAGEFWKITESVLNVLDNIEGYPDFFHRQIIETQHGPAWMYYMPNKVSKAKQIIPDATNTVRWNKASSTFC